MKTMIETLQARAADLTGESRSLIDAAEASNRDFTAAESTRFDSLIADVTAVRSRIAELNGLAESERQIEQTLSEYPGVLSNGNTHPLAGGSRSAEASWLPSRREYADLVSEQRATGFSNAGAVLNTVAYNGWFDKLRTRSVVLAAAPRILPVAGRSLVVPVLTGSVTVGNYAENTTITASDPALAGPVLTPVKLAALTLASNESLNDSSPALREILVAAIMADTATALDTEFLVGPGTANRMRGLRNTTGATVVSNPLNGAVPSLDTVLDLLASLEGIGSDLANVAVFMTPGVWAVLRKIKSVSGGTYLVQPDPTSPARPSLFGARVFVTGNLPQTEVSGTSGAVCSTIIAADMSRVAVGVGGDVSVQISEDFAFDKDQSAVRVTARFDVAALNSNAVALAVGNKLA